MVDPLFDQLAGIATVQLFLSQTDSNFWRYNQRSDVSSMTADRCREIAETWQETPSDVLGD